MSPAFLLNLQFNGCVKSDYNSPILRTVRTFQAPMFQPIFLPLKPVGTVLCIRGLSWKFHTIYVLQNMVSTIHPISSNAGGREGCFYIRFVYPKLTDAERLVSTCSIVGIAWWIMTI